MELTEHLQTPTDSSSKNTDELEALISRGECALLLGDLDEALELFAEAEDTVYPELHYRMGLSLFEYGSDEGQEEVLLMASKKLKKAHLLDPNDGEILHAWGNTLALLGERYDETPFFLEAKNKYEKALGLVPSSQLFWDYGAIWYYLGVHSEEAVDLQKSLNAYERALEEEADLPAEFWVDYGASALLLALKVPQTHHIVKAVNCFKHAVSKDNESFNAWSSLAEALEALYEYTHDEDHFSQANECFEKASQISPHVAEHWLDWAKFLLSGARRNLDIKRVRSCLEKCHHAYALDTEDPIILTTWAEALALLGQLTERLDLIYEAENKIAEALDLDEEDPEIWLSLGRCFDSFGHYFHDYDYFYQAIEKFQTGLSIDRTCDALWHAMANTYATVGRLEDDPNALEQSLKFYEKALSFTASSTRYVDYASALAKLGELTHDQKRLEQSIPLFEVAFSLQRNAAYLHPEWLFSYANALDVLADYYEEEKYYLRAIELFSHVLMIDPEYPRAHQRLAQAISHLGELTGQVEYFYRAIHHLRLALKLDEDNDSIYLDWGIALIQIAQYTPILTDVEQLMQDAGQKLTQAAKLGNVQAYYQLSCYFSLLREHEKALYFLMKADSFHALPHLDDLLHDDWLEYLRMTSEFQDFLSQHPHYHRG
jgi:tetratricopeptide (TPR) repeat protein